MAPNCFISYSWDDQKHKDWVLQLATGLQLAGVHVFLDQWDVHLGMDLVQYMETSIRDSDYVLLVCTPLFADKANTRKGGVGYEQMVVTGEIFQGSSGKKFVPVLRRGEPHEALPSFLRSRGFLDFRHGTDFKDSLDRLLRHLHASQAATRPPLGPVPAFTEIKKSNNAPAVAIAPIDLKLFAALERFAYSPTGLNLSTREAKMWAEERMVSWRDVDVDALAVRFTDLREFAYSPDGLNLSGIESKTWAKERMLSWEMVDLPAFVMRFRELQRFAFGPSGLNLSTAEARNWALKKVYSEFGVE